MPNEVDKDLWDKAHKITRDVMYCNEETFKANTIDGSFCRAFEKEIARFGQKVRNEERQHTYWESHYNAIRAKLVQLAESIEAKHMESMTIQMLEAKANLEKERTLSDRLGEILRQILSLTKHRKVPVAQIHDLAIKALGGGE